VTSGTVVVAGGDQSILIAVIGRMALRRSSSRRQDAARLLRLVRQLAAGSSMTGAGRKQHTDDIDLYRQGEDLPTAENSLRNAEFGRSTSTS
jgi:hypothetical protein